MNIVYRQGNKLPLAQLRPQARGHALEPCAAYRELRARLGTATDEVRRDWLSLRDLDGGCTQAASRLIGERQGPARMTAADAEVVAPAALRDRLREHARTVAEMYDPVTT
jgi:hypothetical protein